MFEHKFSKKIEQENKARVIIDFSKDISIKIRKMQEEMRRNLLKKMKEEKLNIPC